MKSSIITSIIVFLALAAMVSALPLSVDSVEVNDVKIVENGVNQLQIERGQEISLKIQATAQANLKDVEMLAFISGYEFNDLPSDRISDNTQVMDLESNTTYVRTLTLTIPDDVEIDSYKLRLIISDRNNDQILQNYNLKIDALRHSVNIKDVLLYPGTTLRPGSALLAKVRVKNLGQMEESDIKVIVSIPTLGTSTSEYIDEIKKTDKQEESEEMLLRIPSTAQPGTYQLKVEALYNDGRRTTIATQNIVVEEVKPTTVVAPEPTIIVTNPVQAIRQEQTGAYGITITNNEDNAKEFSLAVSAAQDLTISVQPSNTIVVEPKATKTITLYVTPSSDTNLGPKSVTLAISSAGKIVKQETITATVQQATTSGLGMLEITLMLLIIILLVVGAVILFAKQDSNKAKSQPYY